MKNNRSVIHPAFPNSWVVLTMQELSVITEQTDSQKMIFNVFLVCLEELGMYQIEHYQMSEDNITIFIVFNRKIVVKLYCQILILRIGAEPVSQCSVLTSHDSTIQRSFFSLFGCGIKRLFPLSDLRLESPSDSEIINRKAYKCCHPVCKQVKCKK